MSKLSKKDRILATAIPCSVTAVAGIVTGAVMFARYLKKEKAQGWEYDPDTSVFSNEETGEAKVVLPV